MLRLAILLCGLATPLHALSCMRPDAVRLYEAARDSEALYTVVRGRLIGEVDVPQPDENGTIPEGMVLASSVRIVGDALSRVGFDTPFDERVDINVTCLGPWCGGASEGEAIYGLLHTPKGLQLWAEPCAPWQVPVTDTGVERLLACHRSEVCLPGQ